MSQLQMERIYGIRNGSAGGNGSNQYTKLLDEHNVNQAKTQKQVAGQSIFEIGRRLKYVKENDLVHGEFGKWLNENVSFTDRQARRFIQAYEEFKTDDVVRIGTSKIFEMLSLPSDIDRQDFVKQQHKIPSTGEQKTIDEMTVKEFNRAKFTPTKYFECLNFRHSNKKRTAHSPFFLT